MSSKATTPESRNYVAQLNSLLNFYTKPAASENIPVQNYPKSLRLQEINWAQWKEQLFTEGLVDKVKANHDSLKEEDYNVEVIITQLVSAPSKELEEIV